MEPRQTNEQRAQVIAPSLELAGWKLSLQAIAAVLDANDALMAKTRHSLAMGKQAGKYTEEEWQEACTYALAATLNHRDDSMERYVTVRDAYLDGLVGGRKDGHR